MRVVAYPGVEVASRPVLIKGLMALGPPELLRDFKVVAFPAVHQEPLCTRPNHAAVRTFADGHLRLIAAAKHRFQQLDGLGRTCPFFPALHLLSSGKAGSLNEADFHIT